MEKHLRIIFILCCVGVSALLFFNNLTNKKPFLVFSGTPLKDGQRTNVAIPNTSYKSAYLNSPFRFNSSSSTRNPLGTHTILWWNEPEWMIRIELIRRCNLSLCEYPNCEMTANKATITQSSVVIVSVVHDGSMSILSQQRIMNQPWIFYERESPAKFPRDVTNMDTWDGVFNWSMTYHRNADIFFPYGQMRLKTYPPNKDYSAIFRNKTNQVAWIVSHCKTVSEREHYVEELRKYIPVDVYGKCAGNRIEKTSFQQILSKYKFYLGFENAFCRDYVTEKYFRYLKYDLIIVVRGLTDYDSLLPNRTFINTANFGSIESLANYLKKLSNNETEYIHYLKEKDKYYVHETGHLYCESLCTICEKVNNLQENSKIYDNIFDWTDTCKAPPDLGQYEHDKVRIWKKGSL